MERRRRRRLKRWVVVVLLLLVLGAVLLRLFACQRPSPSAEASPSPVDSPVVSAAAAATVTPSPAPAATPALAAPPYPEGQREALDALVAESRVYGEEDYREMLYRMFPYGDLTLWTPPGAEEIALSAYHERLSYRLPAGMNPAALPLLYGYTALSSDDDIPSLFTPPETGSGGAVALSADGIALPAITLRVEEEGAGWQRVSIYPHYQQGSSANVPLLPAFFQPFAELSADPKAEAFRAEKDGLACDFTPEPYGKDTGVTPWQDALTGAGYANPQIYRELREDGAAIFALHGEKALAGNNAIRESMTLDLAWPEGGRAAQGQASLRYDRSRESAAWTPPRLETLGQSLQGLGGKETAWASLEEGFQAQTGPAFARVKFRTGVNPDMGNSPAVVFPCHIEDAAKYFAGQMEGSEETGVTYSCGGTQVGSVWVRNDGGWVAEIFTIESMDPAHSSAFGALQPGAKIVRLTQGQ